MNHSVKRNKRNNFQYFKPFSALQLAQMQLHLTYFNHHHSKNQHQEILILILNFQKTTTYRELSDISEEKSYPIVRLRSWIHKKFPIIELACK